MTEITDITTIDWVLVDARCGLCRGFAQRWGVTLHRLGFRIGALQQPPMSDLRLDLEAMRTIDARRQRIDSGADAVLAILRRHPLCWPLGHLLQVPPLIHLARWAYRLVARHRHQLGCALTTRTHAQ